MVNDDYFGECVKRNNAMPIKVGSQSEIFSHIIIMRTLTNMCFYRLVLPSQTIILHAIISNFATHSISKDCSLTNRSCRETAS